MDYEIWPLGDRALLLRFGLEPTLALNAAVHHACAALKRAELPGVQSIAPAYSSLMLDLDVRTCRQEGGMERLRERIDVALAALDTASVVPGRLIEVAVRYGGEDGPDLAAVADWLGLTAQAVVDLHASVEYPVAMIGFLPGFPYLLGLPAALELPRREQVRSTVAPGSVAIAGRQTGIYPQASPGGWHLIGRTEQALFHSDRPPYALVEPGDRVRFLPVA